MTEREIVFWDCSNDVESLYATEIAEAVERWADDLELDEIPETVTVYGFARMELPSASRIATRVLGDIVEWLDEEHGDPEGEGTAPTESMRAAALTFAEVLRAEYTNWSCEQVTSIVVNVREHLPAGWFEASS